MSVWLASGATSGASLQSVSPRMSLWRPFPLDCTNGAASSQLPSNVEPLRQLIRGLRGRSQPQQGRRQKRQQQKRQQPQRRRRLVGHSNWIKLAQVGWRASEQVVRISHLGAELARETGLHFSIWPMELLLQLQPPCLHRQSGARMPRSGHTACKRAHHFRPSGAPTRARRVTTITAPGSKHLSLGLAHDS